MKTLFKLKYIIFQSLIIFSLISCSAVKTTHCIKDSDSKPLCQKGIPYFLPQGNIEISFSPLKSADGEFESFDIKTETKLTPDPSKLYILNSESKLLSSQAHSIKLSNGMLSSIRTEDEGQIDEVAKLIAGTWINFLKVDVLKQTVKEFQKIDKTVVKPADNISIAVLYQELVAKYQELKALESLKEIKDLKDNNQSLILNGAKFTAKSDRAAYSTYKEKIDLLNKTSEFDQRTILLKPGMFEDIIGDVFLLKASPAEYSSDIADFNDPDKDVSGIVVKVPVPAFFNVSLEIDHNKLYLNRLYSLDAEYIKLNKQIKKLKTEKDTCELKLDEFENNIKENEAKIKEINKKIGARGTPPEDNEKLEKAKEALIKIVDKDKSDIEACETTSKSLIESEKQFAQNIDDILINCYILHRRLDGKDYINSTLENKPDIVFMKEMFTLIPSNYAVNIPMENSVVGKTIYDLQFDSGILTSFSVQKPSSIVELVKVPFAVTEEIISQLTQFIQLRINLATNAKEYVKVQKEIEELKFDLDHVEENKQNELDKQNLEHLIAMLNLEKDNLEATASLQQATLALISVEDMSELEKEEKTAKLRAEIAKHLTTIKENEKLIAEAEAAIKALRK